MKVFKDGCEIKLTYADLYQAIDFWLQNKVFSNNCYSADKNDTKRFLTIKSLSLHPGNKYGARISIGYPESEDNKGG